MQEASTSSSVCSPQAVIKGFHARTSRATFSAPRARHTWPRDPRPRQHLLSFCDDLTRWPRASTKPPSAKSSARLTRNTENLASCLLEHGGLSLPGLPPSPASRRTPPKPPGLRSAWGCWPPCAGCPREVVHPAMPRACRLACSTGHVPLHLG